MAWSNYTPRWSWLDHGMDLSGSCFLADQILEAPKSFLLFAQLIHNLINLKCGWIYL